MRGKAIAGALGVASVIARTTMVVDAKRVDRVMKAHRLLFAAPAEMVKRRAKQSSGQRTAKPTERYVGHRVCGLISPSNGSAMQAKTQMVQRRLTKRTALRQSRRTAVYNRRGKHLASVYNLLIDKYPGQLAYAVTSFGLLGIGESY
jgi:hypothetical protein